MSRITRSLIAAVAACSTLTLVSATTGHGLTQATPVHPASSDLAALGLLTVDDPAAAQAAGEYIVAQLLDGHVPGDAGGMTADVVLSLLAIGGFESEVETATDWLETQAPTYAVANGPGAGKFALVAAAAGRDARNFGGVDLVAEIEGATQESGQCGGFGFAFGQSLCILGLVRAGAPVPQASVDFLLTFQDESGAYGYDGGGFVPDNDASGLTLAALAGVVDQEGADPSAVAVRDYLRTAQDADGYWTNFAPVNTTGVVGPAMQLVGDDVTVALDWMVGQQLADGGLPNVLDGQTSDLMATTQGAMLLAGESYLSVGTGGTDRVVIGEDEPGPTDPGPTGPEPTDPGPTGPEPTDPGPTVPEPTDPGPTVPEPTGPEPTDPGPTGAEPTDPEPTGPVVETDIVTGDSPPAILVAGGLALAAGAVIALAAVLLRRRA